ncbi:MAG: hypothetical protein ABIT36_03215 [Steroidobacteraceae bacterium]
MQVESWRQRSGLYVVLIAAVLQGWALYALHIALRDDLQITNWIVFPALYVLAVFTPLTLQLLAQYAQRPFMWLLVLGLSAVFFAVAWHQSSLRLPGVGPSFPFNTLVPAAAALTLLWLHALPFMQARLLRGRWRPRYPDLFAASWRNVLVLLEAAVFTLALWALLFLCAQLFVLLDIDFFRELFREPLFIYPISALTFGLAIHLIGSLDRIVSVVLDQVLSLFKWLGLVAGLILMIFSVALLTRLPQLVATGTRTIGAHWLLWLVALTVLLLNAAWRDGGVLNPYPRVLGNALRCAVPLLLPVALIALFSLVVRADTYGLTVQRVWGFVVAAIALAYALGYFLAALRGGQWLASLGSTNVAVALAFMVLMLLFLTPPLSPQRLTASSQYARVLAAVNDRAAGEALRTLRFETGTYGREKLQELQRLVEHPRAQSIRAEATRMLTLGEGDRFGRPVATSPAQMDASLDALRIYPSGRKLDASLRAALRNQELAVFLRDDRWVGLFLNVNDTPAEEFVILSPYLSLLFRQAGDVWEKADASFAAIGIEHWDSTIAALALGEVSAQPTQWQDLHIGALTLPVARPASR